MLGISFPAGKSSVAFFLKLANQLPVSQPKCALHHDAFLRDEFPNKVGSRLHCARAFHLMLPTLKPFAAIGFVAAFALNRCDGARIVGDPFRLAAIDLECQLVLVFER